MTVSIDIIGTRCQLSTATEWIGLSMEEATEVLDALGRWLGVDTGEENALLGALEEPYSNAELHSAEAR